MKKKKKRGRKAAGTKKTPRARKPQRVVRKKRAVKKAAAVPLPAPPVETPPYVAPRRVHIKDAVCAPGIAGSAKAMVNNGDLTPKTQMARFDPKAP